MKTFYLKKLYSQIRFFCTLFLLLIYILPAISQTDTIEKKATKMKFSFVKKTDDSKNLICQLSVKIEKDRYFIKDLPVIFYFVGDSTKILGTVKSDNKGIALFTIPAGMNLPANKEGLRSFKAVYEGNNVFEEADGELQVKDAEIEMVLSEDSVKRITINANEVVGDQKNPVEGSTIILYVQRSLGLLKIKDQEMTGGTAEFDFPGDLPGDNDGNLTIIAKFEEDDNFGTVEKTVVKKWGIPLKVELATNNRELWSPDAPLWMSITLFILIIAVLIHYMVIVFKLYKINQEGKSIK